MTTEDKLELIEVYRRITELERKVFKWKHRRQQLLRHLLENFHVWITLVMGLGIGVYIGSLMGFLWSK